LNEEESNGGDGGAVTFKGGAAEGTGFCDDGGYIEVLGGEASRGKGGNINIYHFS
jgi:hypothetical protein